MTRPTADPLLAQALLAASRELSQALAELRFGAPVSHVYNPLDYARAPAEAYLTRYAASRKRVIFVGMNPGPFGMVQTGVPFGEVAVVRDWLGLEAPVLRPAQQNPQRPIEGFGCARSEVSGRRLWGLFRDRFETPERFFAEHLVANYCPLAFFDGARNLTPDKLPVEESRPLEALCDRHLQRVVELLEPEWLVGVGAWAERRARAAADGLALRFGRILHPSPASPAANRGWSEAAVRQLVELGIWPA